MLYDIIHQFLSDGGRFENIGKDLKISKVVSRT
jgi:hypothetical protein